MVFKVENVFHGLSKSFLSFFNLIFMVAGIVLIIVGCSAVTGLRHSQDYTECNIAYLSAIILIVAGVVLFLVAYLACLIPLQENHCMFCTYLSVLFIVGIATLVAVVVFNMHRNAVLDLANKAIDGSYRNDTGIQNAMDVMQIQLECCGLNGPKDWEFLGKNIYPKSCCAIPEKDGCHRVYHLKSCREAINDFLNSNQSKLLWVAIISFGSFLVLIGITCLAAIWRRPKYNYYS